MFFMKCFICHTGSIHGAVSAVEVLRVSSIGSTVKSQRLFSDRARLGTTDQYKELVVARIKGVSCSRVFSIIYED